MAEAGSLISRLVGSIKSATMSIATRSKDERRADRLSRVLRTLISSKGEATGAMLARRSLTMYSHLGRDGRQRFFEILARDFSPDREAVLEAAQAWHRDPTPANHAALQRFVEPPRQEVFRRMNMAPGGTAALVELRNALLEALRDRPHLDIVDQDLTHLLGSWFNRGFLELRRIDWRTPAATLEKLIAYEAVHEIHGFTDLKRRLERDRRCFGFFHPALADEPLIFVEVAFVDELPAAVGPILAPESTVGDPRRAKCAVFYSITSCQPGLRGISFGNFLIKQVASDLHAELPNLKTFATLSPIPGLRSWLKRQVFAAGAEGEAIRSALQSEGVVPDAARAPLEALAAWYLSREWDGVQARDPVARFHLGNGARLERINWVADVSAKGIAQSFGLMVNYVYDLGDVEKNHEDYVNRRQVVQSSAIERAAKEGARLIGAAPG
jgi:malonyl-CoA decarboxylase